MASFASAYGIALNMDYVLSLSTSEFAVIVQYTDGRTESIVPSLPYGVYLKDVIPALYSSLNRNWN